MLRYALIASLVVCMLPAPAAAKGKLHCRNLTFTGQAGECAQCAGGANQGTSCSMDSQCPGSTCQTAGDKVQIRVVDALGNEIHKSCDNVQVKPFESALSFGARMPRDLGVAGDANCGAFMFDPNPTPSNCLVGPGGACKYKWKAKKQVLEICCFAGTQCSGTKIGNYCVGGSNPLAKCTTNANCPGGVCSLRVGTQGISVQKQIYNVDTEFTPTPVPVGMVTTLVELDPIGMTQLPFPALGSCRTDVAKSMTALTNTITDTLTGCHAKKLKTGDTATDCNTVNSDSDPSDRVAASIATVGTVAATCSPAGSPRSLGFPNTCPAPCAGQPISTCAVGQVGTPCSADTNCDSTPGANDGRCGRSTDWGNAASCMTCIAEDGVTTAVEETYGDPFDQLSPEEVRCQVGIGQAFAYVLRTHVGITTKCQKLFDGAKAALVFCQDGQCVAPRARRGLTCATEDDCAPGAERICKYADQSSGRAFAELKARALIQKSCDLVDLTNLDSCDDTVDGIGDCVLDAAYATGLAISDATFPEGIGH